MELLLGFLMHIIVTVITTNGLEDLPNFACDFEGNDCGFTGYMPTDFNWVWDNASTGIGPDVDNTLRTSIGHYLSVNTKSPSTSSLARTGSPFFAPITDVMCLEVFVYSSSWSTFALTGFAIAPEFKSFMELGRLSAGRDGTWKKDTLQIPPQELMFQLVFVTRKSGSSDGLILAIDDILITTGSCSAFDDMDCTFEDENTCGFTHDLTADFDFIRQNSGTPTSYTGPTMDHTLNNENGYYMRIEANKILLGSTARLISPAFKSSRSFKNPSCLIFWYHMYGKHMGKMNVYAMTTDTFPSTTTMSSATLIWSSNGDQGDGWKMSEVAIDMSKDFVIIFEAIRGDGNKGDMAIDDVQLMHSVDCPESELTTQSVKDWITLHSNPVTQEINTAKTNPSISTVSKDRTSEAFQPTTQVDSTYENLSPQSPTTESEVLKSVSPLAIKDRTTLQERTTSYFPRTTGSDYFLSESASGVVTDVTHEGSKSRELSTIPTNINTNHTTAKPTQKTTTILPEETSPMENTSSSFKSKISSSTSNQTTTSFSSPKHSTGTGLASSIDPTKLPTFFSRIRSPEAMNPTTLHGNTTPSKVSKIKTVNSPASHTSTASEISTDRQSMGPTSVRESTTLREAKSSFSKITTPETILSTDFISMPYYSTPEAHNNPSTASIKNSLGTSIEDDISPQWTTDQSTVMEAATTQNSEHSLSLSEETFSPIENSTFMQTKSAIPTTNIPLSRKQTHVYVVTTSKASRTGATDPDGTSLPTGPTSASNLTASTYSTSVHSSVTETAISNSSILGSASPIIPNETEIHTNHTTSTTVTKDHSSEKMQPTFLNESKSTYSTRPSDITISNEMSTSNHPFDSYTPASNTTDNQSITDQFVIPQNISVSTVETTTLLAYLSKTEDNAISSTNAVVSRRQSSASPKEESSHEPAIISASFFEKNQEAVISIGIILGLLGIGATVAVIIRFWKAGASALSFKHRGCNRVGAVEATEQTLIEPSKVDGMSDLPSVESVEMENIYFT
ncbi:chitinase-like protein PB1E7.04c [Lytechinus variegatus]|uniref:chitinase-like protein PB1E7.04c n=1 Tax=Lytechinus variegatus TaxID=7654 RepID=UPI001BB120A8|nr:chitinase-like protein PB1E7.04c [Lytechinus variegatus]